MDRRHLIAALACWPGCHLLAADETPRPRLKIHAGRLYEALTARFPLRFGAPALLEVEISARQLLLLPARNQLGATLLAQAGGLQVQQAPSGEMDLVFALRYEAADQTLRAHGPAVLDIRLPGLPRDTAQRLQAVLPAMLGQMGELVLYRFSPGELALPDTMGLEPQEIEVVDDGLVIWFGPKPRP